MDHGRVNAMATAAMVVLIILIIGQSELARATTYTVGDASGWTFNVTEKWPREGDRFKAGDTFVFSYSFGAHNVVVVKRATDYQSCTAPSDAKVYSSGNDKIELVKGENFFICSFPDHCQKFGVKIAVNATN
ncbi:Phytocyanin domain containing protein [Trema orientale]|uniref:Basic blue protein n=1 Tax=Trema orientale TaxID=63057 RepID=A0A2P5BRX4_TREOI|nr:Phytocyanin domain containing protein [Trema orientale]